MKSKQDLIYLIAKYLKLIDKKNKLKSFKNKLFITIYPFKYNHLHLPFSHYILKINLNIYF